MRIAVLLLMVLLVGPALGQSADRGAGRAVPAGCDHRVGTAAAEAPERGGPEAGGDTLQLWLRKATGNLRVYGRASRDTYQIYFHVPISFHEQAPVLLEVSCPQMVDYRFVRQDPPNLLVAARLVSADSAVLNWTSWVVVEQNLYPNLPTYVPIPAPGELPDSVRQYLEPTDCCQTSAPIVRSVADSVRDTTTNLMKMAQGVCDYCRRIPWQFPHEPCAFDAVYTLKWGNSCTGHAHAAAALLRACGIPARPLLNIFIGVQQDMHWIVDYYVPGYGWVRMESAVGNNRQAPEEQLVVQACNPSDEFAIWFPCAIDAGWHSSDTAYGMWTPDWGLGHDGRGVTRVTDSTWRVNYAIALTHSVYDLYSSYWGIGLSPVQAAAFAAGLGHQTAALAWFRARVLAGYLAEMEQALADYQAVNPAPVETLYSESFEGGPAGWTHGGVQDEWELGAPTFGPARAHSGGNCWGTNLDGPYANNDDCWLLSPGLDVSELASASLSFWIWNSVQDVYGYVYDPVWVEISRDGVTFDPLSSRMGGVNDDPEITAIGGWSRVVLDLAQYIGDTVQVRFRFRSDGQTVFAGSYIDDVQIVGRRTNAGVAESPKPEGPSYKPGVTVVRGVLRTGDRGPATGDRAELLDACGRKVLDLKPGANEVGRLAPGVYFYRLDTRGLTEVKRVVVVK